VVGAAVVVGVVEGDGVPDGDVEGDAVVVVRTGEAAAWAGTITEFTTGRVQDLGSRFSAAPPPTPAPIAFKSGRRSISLVISKPPTPLIHAYKTGTLSTGRHPSPSGGSPLPALNLTRSWGVARWRATPSWRVTVSLRAKVSWRGMPSSLSAPAKPRRGPERSPNSPPVGSRISAADLMPRPHRYRPRLPLKAVGGRSPQPSQIPQRVPRYAR